MESAQGDVQPRGCVTKMRLPSLGLRNRLIALLILSVATMSFATLLVVHYSAEKHLQQEIVTEAKSTQVTFQAVLRQRQTALNRKAALLATVATERLVDDTSVQDTADNPLETDGSDLIAITDAHNHVTTLHCTNPHFTAADVEQLLPRALEMKRTADWWHAGGSLYQVSIQRIERQDAMTDDPQSAPGFIGPLHDVAEPSEQGTLIVGREMGYAAIHEMGKMSSAGLAFSYGSYVVGSTLTVLDEHELDYRIEGLAQGQVSQKQIQIEGQPFFAISVPLTNETGPSAHLVILQSYSEAVRFLNELNRLLTVLCVLALLGSTVLAVFIANSFTHPLAQLDEGVKALAKGDYSFPLSVKGDDEVARVTQGFNDMRETLQRNESTKKQLEDQLRQSQKMEALGRLAGGVAHDFNNLLTVIKGHCDLIVDRMDADHPLAGSGKQIRNAADRAAALTRQMLAFSRRQTLEPTVVDLNTLVADMYKLMARLVKEDIDFNFKPGTSLGHVKADAGQMEQVLLNLVVNACDAMPKGGKLLIETTGIDATDEYASCHGLPPGKYAMLTVTDTGCGMDPEVKEHIFEPFFTTKPAGKGTGLGLATVYGVVKQSGGHIWVESARGVGSRFEIYFPTVNEAVTLHATPKPTLYHARNAETVLLAEDEDAVRDLASQFLTSAGYNVLMADDGERALKLAQNYSGKIDLLITDVVMPRMRGPELAARLKRERPDVKVIFMSGYIDHDTISGEYPIDDSDFVQKPFSRGLLVQKTAHVLRDESPSVAAQSVA